MPQVAYRNNVSIATANKVISERINKKLEKNKIYIND
jgi:hypothetical protein